MGVRFDRARADAEDRGVLVRVLPWNDMVRAAGVKRGVFVGKRDPARGNSFIEVRARHPERPSDHYDLWTLRHELGHARAFFAKEESLLYEPFYDGADVVRGELPRDVRVTVLQAEIRAWAYAWADEAAHRAPCWGCFQRRAQWAIATYARGLRLLVTEDGGIEAA